MSLNDDFYSEKALEKYGKKTEQSRDVENYDYFELTNGMEVAVNKERKISIEFWLFDDKVNFYRLDNKSMK